MEYMVMLNAAGITKGSSGHYGGYVLIKPVKISEIIKLTGDSVKLPRDAKSDVLSVLGRYVYKPNLTRKVNDPHAKPKQATVEYDGSGQLENQAQRP
jgi:hypothetical protein